MGYDRYPRGNPGYRQDRDPDYDRESYSNARDYGAVGYGRDDDHDDRSERSRYGGQERDRTSYARPYGGGQMFEGRNRNPSNYDRNYRSRGQHQQGYGRQPQGYSYDDRGFIDRAGDEVRSWFGDDDAERRREMDRRFDERYNNPNDGHYDSWRRQRIDELDRDYDEYRRENASKFHDEFATWRTERAGQRTSLSRVSEHMEVVGSDGAHVGTVDKVRGDRILLTKNDQDAGGRHHSIPSRWIQDVSDKVMIRKTADEAKHEWRDEERNQAMFGDRDEPRSSSGSGSTNLNRSFSGTY